MTKCKCIILSNNPEWNSKRKLSSGMNTHTERSTHTQTTQTHSRKTIHTHKHTHTKRSTHTHRTMHTYTHTHTNNVVVVMSTDQQSREVKKWEAFNWLTHKVTYTHTHTQIHRCPLLSEVKYCMGQDAL